MSERGWRVGLVALVLLLVAPAAGQGARSPRSPADLLVLPSTQAVSLLPPPRLAARMHPYGWPLRPFDQAHVVRGGFGDPRFGAFERNFHFGLDIAAAGGTPVYAVAPGTVFLEPDHVDVLASQRGLSVSGFSYWHILPAVTEHAFVRLHALLGWVSPAWGHLHFSEIDHSRYVNPLRTGALTPQPPPFAPTIASVMVAPTATGSQSEAGYTGRVAIVANVYALPSLQPPAPWQNAIVAPASIRWRLLDSGDAISNWQTAVDFRTYIPPDPLYHDVYAAGTRPNKPGRPGTYLFYLARDWNLNTLPPGNYTIQVEADSSGGTTTIATAPLPITTTQPAQT